MIYNGYDIDMLEIYDKLGGKQTLPKRSLELGQRIPIIQVKIQAKKYYKIYIYPIVVINSIFFKSNKNFRPPSLSYKCAYGEAIYAG